AVREVLQHVAVSHAALEASTIARMQDLLALVHDQRNNATQHVHELVLHGVPMALARPCTLPQPNEVNAELREVRGVAELLPMPLLAGLVIRCRVARTLTFLKCRDVNPHVASKKMAVELGDDYTGAEPRYRSREIPTPAAARSSWSRSNSFLPEPDPSL